jgi:hypothetical protein
MAISLIFDDATRICEMTISGKLDHSGFKASEEKMTALIASGRQPRILVVLEGFLGWDQQGNWDNLNFMFNHGDKIARIAVVGDKRWESDVRLFTGAGIRKTPVGYFETERIEDARAWLLG